MKNVNTSSYIKNIIFPCVFFGGITGVFTGCLVFLFKAAATAVIHCSEGLFAFLRVHPVWIVAALILAVIPALCAKPFYGFFRDSKGGGIPSAIAVIRGLISFKWIKNIVGVFFASLVTFFFGVPLGNEGPCVQMGTAVGRGVINVFGKRNKAWDRYVMTGGASAGFAAATGAPVSGILFAMEEAHRKISPMIIMVATVTVSVAFAVVEVLAKIFSLDMKLFAFAAPDSIGVRHLWLPVLIGVGVGLFSTALMYLYKIVNKQWRQPLKKTDIRIKFFIIFAVTVIFGILSADFIGTGRTQIFSAVNGKIIWYMAIAIILFRSVLLLFSNNAGFTGGMFVPMLALGALVSSVIASALVRAGWLEAQYYGVAVLLGIVAGLAGMVKAPVTAICFALEALSLYKNILPVVIAAMLAYLITELFGMRSVNDYVIKRKVAHENAQKIPAVYEAFVTVQENSFAVGKTEMDILWPHKLTVLSLKRSAHEPIVDSEGEELIRAGDVLHIRFATTEREKTLEQLSAFIGEQEYRLEGVRRI